MFPLSCSDQKHEADSGLYEPPPGLISLSTMTGLSSVVETWGLLDLGQLGPAIRKGFSEKPL